MEITEGMRDLVAETAESLSGADRRRFMANTLGKLRLGQREAARLFSWGRDTLRKACHEARTGVTCAAMQRSSCTTGSTTRVRSARRPCTRTRRISDS